MKFLDASDIEAIALGATIVGSGGGGDPGYTNLTVEKQLDQFGPVPIISVSELADDDLVVPLSMMGAPLVSIERIGSGKEYKALFDLVTGYYGKKPCAIVPSEIGGSNALVPLLCAGELGVSVLDADIIGRAFPELQMSSAELMGINPCPSFIADCYGNAAMIMANDGLTLERIARAMTVQMGSEAAVIIYPMTGAQVKNGGVIAGSLSRVREIGNLVINARAEKKDPTLVLIDAMRGALLAQGMITDFDCAINDGFMRGTLTVASNSGQSVTIYYQNEYLVVRDQSCVIASTPDIIMLLEVDSGIPVTSERLTYGTRVNVIMLPGPDIWKTQKGLSLVGPRAFGFDFDYQGRI